MSSNPVPSSKKPKTRFSLFKRANAKFDTLKLFIRLLKDLNIINSKKYLELQKQIQEIGRMLGGWQRSLS